MNHKWVIFTFFTALLWIGCQSADNSSTKQEAQQTATINKNKAAPPKDTKVESSKKPALTVEQMSAFFPSLEGYTKKGEPKGNSADFSKFSVSQVEQAYSSQDGQEAKVTIFDYNDASPLQSAAQAAIEKAVLIENDRQLTKAVDLGIDGVASMLVVQKADNSAHLTISAGNRFLVTIQGKGEELVTMIGKEMPYDTMIKTK